MARSTVIAIVVLLAGLGRTQGENPSDSSPTRSTEANLDDPRDEIHWSFRPIRDTAPPPLAGRSDTTSPIDRFLLAELESKGLSFAEPADRVTLLRRATFDLTGLPPSPEEIDEFLADTSDSAFERLVDRLLASPRYGEKWGRHWLDVVRYADARDLIQLPEASDFREAWRYRDWVVSAHDRDLPFDDFIRRQIAGDLPQPADPGKGNSDHIDAEALIATGFLAIADFVPGDVDKEGMIADYVNDQIDVVGRAILGLTLACARCHDHKFDPTTTEDYYALAGIFFSTSLVPGPIAGNTPLTKAPLLSAKEIRELEERSARDRSRLAELTRQSRTATDREFHQRMRRFARDETLLYLQFAWEYEHRATEQAAESLENFAAARGVAAAILTNWLKYLKAPPPAFSGFLRGNDPAESERRRGEIAQLLTREADRRAAAEASESMARPFTDAEILRFRADDARIDVNEAGQAIFWPDRAGLADDAALAPETLGPTRVVAKMGERERPVMRFSGKESLLAPRVATATGSLVVLFRAGGEASGRRLIGWEDSDVGKHGLGLLTGPAGEIRAVLRREGANGDIVAPPLAAPGFQLITLSWGPGGVTLFRDGQRIGSNTAIEEVSLDPEIKSLRIGGPGSGGAGGFIGDLAELRLFEIPLDDSARERVEGDLRDRWFEDSAPVEAPRDPIADLYDDLLSSRGPYWAAPANRQEFLDPATQTRLKLAREELDELKRRPAPVIPMAVAPREGGPADTRFAGFHDVAIHTRGDHKNLGAVVPRGFPRFLAGENQPPIVAGSGRRELAEWLTQRENPLTARVIVNRVWQHHFGAGLVRTSSNFGVNGEAPSHPALLDYLATRFLESGGSIKSLHRSIMLSAAYRQSAQGSPAAKAADPENRLWARFERRRLSAEEIRDSLVFAAERLDTRRGGPGFLGAKEPRRAIYSMSIRTGVQGAGFGPLFDAPDCGAIVERRGQTTVAPQALFLMNDDWVFELAQSLAERILREAPADFQARVDRLYRVTLGRSPTLDEVKVGRELLVDGGDLAAWSRYSHILLCANEFIYVD